MRTKIHTLGLIFLLFTSFCSYAQQDYWLPKVAPKKWSKGLRTTPEFYELELQLFSSELRSKSTVVLPAPNTSSFLRFSLEEASNFHPNLQKKYPNIRAYKGISSDGKYRLVLSSSEEKISVMYAAVGSNQRFFLEQIRATPLRAKSSKSQQQWYVVYTTDDFELPEWACELQEPTETPTSFEFTAPANLKTYRIAISTTGQYTAYHGQNISGALAAINATLTRVNGIYENEIGVRFELIEQVEQLIYLNRFSDPYFENLGGDLQEVLDDVIGDENYDIGHLFHQDRNSGNAGFVGATCQTGKKGSAYSSGVSPEGALFDIDYVCHEIGHQMGANHTWSFQSENTGVQFEPGSGSTIMAYAGIIEGENLQEMGDAYFHIGSLIQMQGYMQNFSCYTDELIANNPPDIATIEDTNIPALTPFVLSAEAFDTDGDELQYSVEQIDNGIVNSRRFGPLSMSGANFRALPPSADSTRYFPNISRVFAQELTQTSPGLNDDWESLTTINKAMHFALVVRDGNQVQSLQRSVETSITVDADKGPFRVLSQSAAQTFTAGDWITLVWDVAQTNLPPINTQELEWYLIDTSGIRKATEVSNILPNTGQAEVQLPNQDCVNCRIMLKAVKSVYFNVNTADLIIESQSATINLPQQNYKSCENELIIDTYVSIQAASAGPYELNLNTENSTVSLSESTFGQSGAATLNFDLSALDLNATESVQLSLVDSNSTTVFNTSIQLEKAAQNPELTILNTPADLSENLGAKVALAWQENQSAERYLLEWSQSPSFENTASIALYDIAYVLESLAANSTYYWRVSAFNPCGNTSVSEVFSFTTAAVDCKTQYATDLPQSIAAQTPNTVSSEISINDELPIESIEVGVRLTHTYVGDLQMRLISPTGTIVPLLYNSCAERNNINVRFSDNGRNLDCLGATGIAGVIRPAVSFAKLYGESTLGKWILEVEDGSIGDAGILQEFFVKFCAKGAFEPDQDLDGVFDTNDLCLDTRQGQEVDTDGCPIYRFTPEFFAFSSRAETCDNLAAGVIQIAPEFSAINFSYTLNDENGNLVRQGSFSSSLFEIDSLPAGIYNLCITGQSGDIAYEPSCFEFDLSTPPPLALTYNYNRDLNRITLFMEGEAPYRIILNANEQTTNSRQISLNLDEGLNQIQVFSAIDCLEPYTLNIITSGESRLSKNPIQDHAKVILSKEVNFPILVKIFNLEGRLLRSNLINQFSPELDIDFRGLPPNMYLLNLRSSNAELNFKVIKATK